MKKLIAVALSAMMCLSVAACQPAAPATTNTAPAPAPEASKAEEKKEEPKQEAASGKKIKIGMTTNDFNDKWMSYLHDAAQAWADEKKDEVEFVLANSQSDINKQMSHVEDFITQGYDAIIIKAVDKDASVPMVKKAKEAGIPIVAVNLEIEGADTYVGADNYMHGVTQVQQLVKMLDGKPGKIGIMFGEAGSIGAMERTRGVKEEVAKHENLSIVAEEIGSWQRDKGMSIMENWMQGGIEMNAVLANNDEMAVGAILAMEAAGVREKYIVAGVDATPDGLQMIKEGRLDMTVKQDAVGQGRGAMDSAYKLVKGETLPPVQIVTDPLINKDNLAEHM